MSRNQKATVMTSGFYGLALILGLWGAMIQPETRITGSVNGRAIDIPVWQQKEPEYQKIKDAKVSQGWGGLRLLVWGLGAVAGITGVTLSAERRSELERERVEYERNCREADAQADIQASYNLSLQRAKLQKKGEAQMALYEDSLVEEVDDIRAANGWFAPEPEPKASISSSIAPAAPIQPNTAFAGMKTPEQYQAEIEIAAEGAKSRLKEDGITGAEVPDDRKKFYQDNGDKIMRSLAALRMSILSAAPTGGGKTHTLYRWLGDLQTLYPQSQVYVIAHKRDSFLGLLEQGRVTIFDDLNPEPSMAYLDKIYAEMKVRLSTPEGDRKKFEKLPIRLILDDWFASFGVLKLYPALWNIVKTKIGAIITKGREANVCFYIATQSFNLEALGIQDSNIRGNLAISCQGLVTEQIDVNGDLVEQGNYESLQLLINNSYIVASKVDRDRLNTELEELVKLSRLHQLPAIFSAVGKPVLALAPYYQKPTNTRVANSNSEESKDDNPPEYTGDDVAKFREKLLELPPMDSSENIPENGWDGEDACNTASNAASNSESNAESNSEIWELENWYKWLPTKAEVVLMMEELDTRFYNFTYLVKNKLKKTEALYGRKTKGAIVRLLLDLDRTDLIEKFQIDPDQFPFID